MAKQSTEQAVSIGQCFFCQETFAKNKMTQHLKSCKERQRINAEAIQAGGSQRIFQLLIEGKYRPNYWMQLEISADATLANLDEFLRAIWLECCGHLSEFTIGDTSYGSFSEEMDQDAFQIIGPGGAVVEDEAIKDEEAPSLDVMASQISTQISTELQADLKEVPVERIEEKLLQLFSDNLPPGLSPATLPGLQPLVGYMAAALQQGTLAEEMAAMEEEDDESEMDIELGEVLKVGDKFSYVYDFGSSTNLSLRVIAERSGVIPEALDDEEDEDEDDEDEDEDDEEDEDEEGEAEGDESGEISVLVIARNEPPALTCRVCGKPATHVLPEEEFGNLEEAGLCDNCAKKHESADELLPVVNSPRVGVCGYTGDEEEEDWDEDEWEEDEEDDE
jgi:hypothetical protein